MSGVEVPPDAIGKTNRGWAITNPIAANGGALFAITAPWCGHCQQLKQQVREAQYQRPFDFFFMDGDKSQAHKLQTNRMGVEGFPTLYRVETGGQLVEYNGGRDVKSLAQNFSKYRMW